MIALLAIQYLLTDFQRRLLAMVHLKTLASTLAVLLLAEIWTCFPPPNKQVSNKGKAVERDIEALDDPMDLALTPSKVKHSSKQDESDLIRGENDGFLGVKKVGKNDQSSKQIESISGSSSYRHLVAVAQEIKMVLRARHDQKTLAKKQADWESVIKNAEWTKEIIYEAIPSRVSMTDLETMKEIVGRLEGLYELIETIYGPQTSVTSTGKSTRQKSLDFVPKPSLELDEYKKWIPKLVSLLDVPTDLGDHNFHVRVAWNRCILQTLTYLYKYHLIPAELAESFQGYPRDPVFLKWLAMESHDTFRPNTRYWSNFHRSLEDVDFLQNHPLLSSIAQIFNELGRREQDFIVFYRLKFVIESFYERTLPYEEMDPNTKPIEAQWHLEFLEKMEKTVSKEFELTNSQYEAELANGLLEVKDELMEMKNFLIGPIVGPEHDNKSVFYILRYSFDILDFAQKKYGAKFIEQLGLNDHLDPRTVQYQRNFEFMKAITQLNLWTKILLDYGCFLLTELQYGREVPPDAWSNKITFFWRKLMESANGYKQTLLLECKNDPTWKEFLEIDPFFASAKRAWDHKIQIFPELYDLLKSLMDKGISDAEIDELRDIFFEK